MKRSLLVFALVAAAGLIVANLFRQTDDWKADAPADGGDGTADDRPALPYRDLAGAGRGD
ncbi:hypothetical protein [Cohnella rhizosphaerae]|uniref:Uncharacterized protein n=1 Tax=Cohnella rhizosphaerae TaxID=1457232 RepID=A0A9X4QTK3_9BACL|nr:hypothetical protein [Cohnella rhizosphaerae]MDG0811286.1 hypothetical protein [Cohnella rhizosphaerae]